VPTGPQWDYSENDMALSKHCRNFLVLGTLLTLLPLLAGCDSAVLDPAGSVAREQRDIIAISTVLMLLIIVPVIFLIVLFAWRYRQSNKDATYDPHFDHSTTLELVIWSAPLLIIICLGALTWSSTHLLDPFRPLDSVSNRPQDASAAPLHVQVVSLDWKWLFIYPDQNIATVNELVIPVDRQVRFVITSSNMMNTFYAPTLAGMIYAMPGMQSTLHAVLNRAGEFDGLSANYSGAGFSDMHFKLRGVDQAGFERWIAEVKASGKDLKAPSYLNLAKPSKRVPVMHFAPVQPDLYQRILERCIEPGKPCISELRKQDEGEKHTMPAARETMIQTGQPAVMAGMESQDHSAHEQPRAAK
jgi:cytochrome o ubiquinol oxidase subunit 2